MQSVRISIALVVHSFEGISIALYKTAHAFHLDLMIEIGFRANYATTNVLFKQALRACLKSTFVGCALRTSL